MWLLMLLLTRLRLSSGFSLTQNIIPRYFSRISKLYASTDGTIGLGNVSDKSTTTRTTTVPVIEYGLPIQVYIDDEIVHYNKINRRKLRLLLPKNIPLEDLTEKKLRRNIEHRMEHLNNQPYILRYALPGMVPKRFESDLEVLEAFKFKKVLQLFVQNEPGVFPPLTQAQSYLANMADPSETQLFTMLSFYKFDSIASPYVFSQELLSLWKPFKVFGRVYVAKEGINAQMSVPTNVIDNFKQACNTLDMFRDLYLNVDHTMTREEFYASKPFRTLHIRVRDQIVADGFDTSLNWEQAGREVNSTQWNQGISNPDTIVLDCRNSYESDVGIFEKAIPLGTTFFRESWDALDEILENVPKDQPIMTYCTGGIRCVKINAYLEQTRGFTNVSRLAGGIVSYVKETQEQVQQQEKSVVSDLTVSPVHLQRDVPASLFRGVNYVFDERMGSRVTKDILTSCETCGGPFDIYTNCKNDDCHIRFIQCKQCSDSYDGCCCKSCQSGLGTSAPPAVGQNQKKMLPRSPRAPLTSTVIEVEDISESLTVLTPSATLTTDLPDSSKHTHSQDEYLDALSTYCERQSSAPPHILEELYAETNAVFSAGAARMICGHLQGRLLVMLASLMKAARVLELGTFTGYSALCFAEGISEGGKVLTCDIDEGSVKVAQSYFARSDYQHKIEQRICKANVVIEECYSKEETFDIIFIDADKKMYLEYLKRVLNFDGREKRSLLNDGGLIIVDNTLWKGLVMNNDEDLKMFSPEPSEYGNPARMRDIATAVHDFNTFVAREPSLKVVLLPLRDGLTVLRYTSPQVRYSRYF